MNVEEGLKLVREIRSCAFATVDEEGNPQIRIIDVMLAKKDCIIFCTAKGKDFYGQLMSGKKIAITGMTTGYVMVRLNGVPKKLDEKKEYMDEIFEENQGMNDVYPGESRYILEPFCIKPEELEVFDLSSTPIHREMIVEKKKKGFVVTKKCITCGKCQSVCPQQCIKDGNPVEIVQENCLHCGLCFETCPVGAIERRE